MIKCTHGDWTKEALVGEIHRLLRDLQNMGEIERGSIDNDE